MYPDQNPKNDLEYTRKVRTNLKNVALKNIIGKEDEEISFRNGFNDANV